jgi:hypothetical protein
MARTTGGQVLFWATLNPFGVSNKDDFKFGSRLFLFWRHCATDASIDAFLLFFSNKKATHIVSRFRYMEIFLVIRL